MMRLRPLIHVLLACSLSFVACSRDTKDAAKGATQGEPRLPEFNRDAAAFEAELAALDHEIAAAKKRAAAQPGGWLVLEQVALLYMSRARLSGDYDDYRGAEQALAEAFERAPEGSGPLLTRAALNFTLHRLEAIAADLDKVAARPLVDKPTQAYIASLRGDVAFERGQYELAAQRYEESLALDQNSSILAKLARWRWRAGEFDQAEALFRDAEAEMGEGALEGRAWVHLQLGIMDLERGRYKQAFEHYRDGAAILGGWWLLEEHIAEIAALQGMRSDALALYDEIIARTGKGEFMDAKASMLQEAGDEAGAAALIEQAAGVYEAQLEQFPEASYGHALGHYLDFGPPARALELAELNHALRPGVLAKIALAEARLATDEVAGAREIIDQALATTWVSAELSWVASLVYAQLGDEEQVAKLRAEAEALHPSIAKDG